MKNKLTKFLMALLVLAALAFVPAALAVDTFPDPTALYTSVATPFNTALGWVIGATAVMLVIGWIRKAMRK